MGLLVTATLRPARARVRRSLKESEGKVERKEKRGEEEGGGAGGCGLEYGFGFPSLRDESEWIDSKAESEADRVAAQGCASYSARTRPRTAARSPLDPSVGGEGGGEAEDVGGAEDDDDAHLQATLAEVAAGLTDVSLAPSSCVMIWAADETAADCLLEQHEKKLQRRSMGAAGVHAGRRGNRG